MKRISTHILDLVLGKPASDVPVRLEKAGDCRLAAVGIRSGPIRMAGAASCCRKAKICPRASIVSLSTPQSYFAAQKIDALYPVVEVTFQAQGGRIAFSYSAAAEPERIHDIPGKLSKETCNRPLHLLVDFLCSPRGVDKLTSSIREWLNLRALVPCFCSDHVGRPNLLLHLAGRPIYDGSRNKPPADGIAAIWMVHSGGFYTVASRSLWAWRPSKSTGSAGKRS